MADKKTWAISDMDDVFPETKCELVEPDHTLDEMAKAAPKPAHHNSKFKAALLLGGGACLAALAALLYSLTGSKTPSTSVATAPEAAQPAASNDGWETAAKQSASDAGQAINIPDTKKTDTKEPPTLSTSATVTKNNANSSESPSTKAQTDSKSSAVPSTSPVVAQIPKVKTSPLAATAPVVATTNNRPVVVQAPTVKPNTKPVPTPSLAPSPAPVAKVEPRPTPREILASNTKPVASIAPQSWDQASSLGVYGGEAEPETQPVANTGAKNKDEDKQTKQKNFDGAMSPTLLLAAGTNVKGHTVAPYSTGVSQSEGVPLTVALDEPIELTQGYRLPVGTTIQFVATVRDNGSVVAISKNADIAGVEVRLPEGAISLAAENNGLLMAKEISTGEGDLARADISSSIWGAAAGAGKAILQSNSQTTTQTGLLGTTTQTTNGSPNIIGAVIDGAFTPLASNGQKRAQQKAEQIQKRSTLNAIDVNTQVKLFVNVPVQVQIPVADQPVAQTTEREELPPPQLVTSNTTLVPATEQLPSPQPAQSKIPQAVLKGLPPNPARTNGNPQ